MNRFLLPVLLISFACSSEHEQLFCSPDDGTYVVKFTEVSGDCNMKLNGDIVDERFTIDGKNLINPMSSENCVNDLHLEGCVIVGDVICDIMARNGTNIHVESNIDFDTRGEGTQESSVEFDSEPFCSSKYSTIIIQE